MHMHKLSARMTRVTTKGFSLLEVFLAIGVLSILTAGAFRIFDDWAKESVNQTVAGEITQHQRSIESFIYSRFSQVVAPFRLDANIPPATFTPINLADVINASFLPSGYTGQTSHRQLMESYFRVVRNQIAPDQYNLAIEVITLTGDLGGIDSSLDNKTLMNTARGNRVILGVVMGAGLVPGLDTNTRATSIQNAWSIPLADIPGYTERADADSGYIAAYSRVVAEGDAINDNVLYRTRIQDRPELNRMETDLRMQNNAVRNASTVNVDYMDVAGNAYIRGRNAATPSDITPALTIDRALRVDGANNRIIGIPDDPATPGVDESRGGNILLNSVDDVNPNGSGASAAPVRVGGTVTSANGSVITDNTNVAGTLTSNGLTSLDTLNNSGNLDFSNRFHTPAFNMPGGPATSSFQTTTLNTLNASVGATNITGVATVGRYNQATANSIVTNNLDVRSTATVNNLNTNNINAQEVLRISGASGTYTDTNNGRTYICSPDGSGRTFCEPSGSANLPNGVTESCALTGTGYECSYTVAATGVYKGKCIYTRSVAGSPAKHNVACVP